MIDMNRKLQLPDGSVARYTASDYRRDIAEGNGANRETLLRKAKARGQGFGFAYMDAVEQAMERHAPTWVAHNNRIKYTESSEDCKVLNRVMSNIREDVDASMQLYIAENQGVIDCWPSSYSASSLILSTYKGDEKEDTDIHFDYFGSDYAVKYKDGRYLFERESDQRVYRNQSHVVDLPEKREMDAREAEIKKTRIYDKKDVRKNRFKHIIARQAWVLAGIYIALILLSRFAGLDLTILKDWLYTAVDSESTVVAALVFIPTLLFMLLMGIQWLLSISNAMFVLGLAGLAFCGYIGRYFLEGLLSLDEPWISRKMVAAGEQACRDLWALWESEEYKRVMEDNKRFRAWQKEQSEQWHKAWFERAQTSDTHEQARKVLFSMDESDLRRMGEMSDERAGRKPGETVADAPLDKLVDTLISEPINDFATRLMREMMARTKIRLAQRPSQQPVDKPAEKPMEKPADKPVSSASSSSPEAESAASLGVRTEKAAQPTSTRSLEDMLKEELSK